ncbi:MAG: hypothetical protein ACXADF_17160 [Candidatus Thorarchaeota archaeon]|jgi:hypothetical protein
MLVRLALALFLLLAATPVWATQRICPYGLLTSAQAATGAGDDVFLPVDAVSIAIQYVRDGGTATVETQICCTESCGSSGDWAQVSGSSKSIDGTTTTAAVGIDNPACVYRTNITACASCDIDTFFRCGAGVR